MNNFGTKTERDLQALANASASVLKSLSRSKRMEMAVDFRLSGLQDSLIENMLGVSRQTHWRWKKTEEYKDQLDRRREELLVQRIDTAGRLLDRFLQILEARLESPDPELVSQLLKIAGPQLIAAALHRGSSHVTGGSVGGSPQDRKEFASSTPTCQARTEMKTNGANGHKALQARFSEAK